MDFLISEIKINFIDDNRYRYILKGLGNTLIITTLALIIGIIIGFFVGIIRAVNEKEKNLNPFLKLLNKICICYITIIRGTPVMLQLLIMYLGILAIPNFPTIIVASLTFGINSGAYVAEIVRAGIMSIDDGQMEAARSLGLPFMTAMRYVIIPQAFKNILPSLGNEFIALLKETSICGYIGVMDLTRGGEIIRSNTFSIWTPLIAIASIYLLIVLILSKLIKLMEGALRKNEK